MPELRQRREEGNASPLSVVGLVVHPARTVERALDALRGFAAEHNVELVQIPFAGEQRQVTHKAPPEHCDLIVALGGDGTTLAAIHRAATAKRPVLGVACGSLGMLTSVQANQLDSALECFAAGHWRPRAIAALRLSGRGIEPSVAFNDAVVIRRGEGQLRIVVRVDGALYTRLAGDGCIISTPAGSSAYTIAAGGPLLVPDLEAYVLTALATHGGFSPPLVLEGSSKLELEITAGHGGGRLEIDGRQAAELPPVLSFAMEKDAATLVELPGQPPVLEGLRERGILADSPRIIADDKGA